MPSLSLWHNNDLWNLLPAWSAVNNHKRDRLPSRELVRSRRDCIVHYWSLLRAKHAIRFEFEVGKLAGPKVARGGNWENRLFHTVTEAIEFTALQRGIERWQPPTFAWVPAADRRATPDSGPSQSTTGDETTESSLIILDPPHRRPVRELRSVLRCRRRCRCAFGPDQPPVDPADHDTWIRIDHLKLDP
jgi:hypothetical protein